MTEVITKQIRSAKHYHFSHFEANYLGEFEFQLAKRGYYEAQWTCPNEFKWNLEFENFKINITLTPDVNNA